MKKTANFLIAAPKSNSGKTLVTLGLIQAFRKRNLNVQTFKCGPDYIDPMHHKYISGKPAYNLDLFMASEEHIKSIYYEKAGGADVAITEGVMGLFDGAKKAKGSSAEVAKLLHLPVVLVVDAQSVAYSIAPLLYGFKNFDTSIQFAGVIFNKVGSESHYQFLKDAANDVGIESLGYVPRDAKLTVESRHLGLHLPDEHNNMAIVEHAANLIEQHVDLDLLLQKSKTTIKQSQKKENSQKGKLKIALASDEAFAFTYQANIDVLEQLGEVIRFSPLHDSTVPNADLLWLPGGYPELFAEQLSNNSSMINSIKQFIESGKTAIAECGGMMYLGKQMQLKDGKIYNMAGAFNYITSLQKMKLHLGYRKIELDNQTLNCHEFHFSEIIQTDKYLLQANIKTARNTNADLSIFRYKNCWASYAHLYLGEPEKMQAFLKLLNISN